MALRRARETAPRLPRRPPADRDRPNTYLSIVEFPSHEIAMENSARPETSAFAARLAELYDGPPRFYNLDVIDTMVTLDVQQRQSQEASATLSG